MAVGLGVGVAVGLGVGVAVGMGVGVGRVTKSRKTIREVEDGSKPHIFTQYSLKN